ERKLLLHWHRGPPRRPLMKSQSATIAVRLLFGGAARAVACIPSAVRWVHLRLPSGKDNCPAGLIYPPGSLLPGGTPGTANARRRGFFIYDSFERGVSQV